jgi:hypothetical protein
MVISPMSTSAGLLGRRPRSAAGKHEIEMPEDLRPLHGWQRVELFQQRTQINPRSATPESGLEIFMAR